MNVMQHLDIKKFSHEGNFRDDSGIIRTKDNFTRLLEDQMRDEGYIPHLDLNVNWSTWWVEEKKCFGFKISMYGVEVGAERSWSEIGYSEGKTYPIK